MNAAAESDDDLFWRDYVRGRRLVAAAQALALGAAVGIMAVTNPGLALACVIFLGVFSVGYGIAWYRVRRRWMSDPDNEQEPPVWISRSSRGNPLIAPAFRGRAGGLRPEPLGSLRADERGLRWYPTPNTLRSNRGIGEIRIRSGGILDVSVHNSPRHRGLVVTLDHADPILFVTDATYGLDFDNELRDAGWDSEAT